MKVKRTGRFKVKASHPDYEIIKIYTIEAKEIYNYANYIIRQIYFKNSENHDYSMEFIHEYPELNKDFEIYLKENNQFTSTFYRIICNFSKIKGHSLNSKMVQNVVDVLKRNWKSYWKLLKLKKEGKYDKPVSIPRYKKKYSVVEYNPQTISKVKLKNGYVGTPQWRRGLRFLISTRNTAARVQELYGRMIFFIWRLFMRRKYLKQYQMKELPQLTWVARF